MSDPFDPVAAIAAARRAAYNASDAVPGDTPVDAAIGSILDHLTTYFRAVKNCAPRDDLDRGHDEAIDWVCSELELLRDSR